MSELPADRAKCFNEHAIFLSDVALCILEGRDDILNEKGVREIIAMYLMIPYMTKDLLSLPGTNCNIPKLDTSQEFVTHGNPDGTSRTITLEGLRNAICHSFATVEDTSGGEYGEQGRLKAGIQIDDRASCDSRRMHEQLPSATLWERLDISATRDKLMELHHSIQDIQSVFIRGLEENSIHE